MRHHKPQLILALLVVVSLACNGSNLTTPTAAPTPDAARTATVAAQVGQGVETAQAEAQAAATSTQAAHSTAAAATAEAVAATSTASFAQTATPARATTVAANRQATKVAATEQAIVAATAQAQPLQQAVEQLVTDGHLSRSAGAYFKVPDFVESWAQIDYYIWYETDFAPTDFVLRADTRWTSASTTANWFNSGCGFVFREQDTNNHYLIYLSLDGYVQLSDFRNGVFHFLGQEYYGKVDTPSGSAQVMLVVDGTIIKYFVNGERVLTRESGSFASGALDLTLVSGTNKDYGTRCIMTHIELWELK